MAKAARIDISASRCLQYSWAGLLLVLLSSATLGRAQAPPEVGLPERVRKLVVHVLGGPAYSEPRNRFRFFTPEETFRLWRYWRFGAHWIVWTDGSVWPRHPGRGRAASWLPPDAPADSGWRARLAREAAPVYGHVVGHNDETVGIELAHSGRSGDAFPERQVRSLAWLLRSLLDLSDGRLSPADVRGHKDLDRRVAYCGKERAGQPVFVDEAGRPYRRRVDPPESVWAGLRLAGLDVPRPPGDLDADLRRAEELAEGVRPACAAR